ncbi:extracellular solute-binding protein [Clostridium paraputrificum]|uniref:extracellular solute-binding protein n=1 Tax=Clostridium paraputrificum TaxID=29363 RepID=UPI003D343761
MKNIKYIVAILVSGILITISFLLFNNKIENNVKGNITIWANSINFDYLNESAKKFMEVNDKSKVNVIKVQSYEYENKVEDAFNKDILPNIIQMDSNYLAKIAEDNRYEISIEQETSIIDDYSKNFTSGRIDEVKVDGKLVGIPLTSRPLVLYLRQDMMDTYGYKHENINTWESLIDMGKDIFAKSNGEVRILNATGQDYDDLISLLTMQAMEESLIYEDVINDVKEKLELLNVENIINTKEGGKFLARISSINGMRELKALEEECVWTANNAPSKVSGSNKFYVAEGDNLVVVSKVNSNSELIRRFIGFLTTNTKDGIEDIKDGQFFLSFLSTYKNREIESDINNFKGKSPLVIMSNITEKAPRVRDYKLYRKVIDNL